MAVRGGDGGEGAPPLGERSADAPGEAMAGRDGRSRLRSQLAFLMELDRLKSVLRMTALGDGGRRENSAEHSWHLAVMAPLLAEHAAEEVDVLRVVKMALLHDVVEIDAGDTFCFDPEAHADKEERERAAAERIFGLLPGDQAAELRALWDEFEARQTPDARYANALDRLCGILQNHLNDGGTWIEHGVSREAILERQDPIREAIPELWPWVVRVMDEALEEAG